MLLLIMTPVREASGTRLYPESCSRFAYLLFTPRKWSGARERPCHLETKWSPQAFTSRRWDAAATGKYIQITTQGEPGSYRVREHWLERKKERTMAFWTIVNIASFPATSLLVFTEHKVGEHWLLVYFGEERVVSKHVSKIHILYVLYL
jgi:hypothetical protein